MFLSTKTTSRLALAVSLVLIVAVLPARGQPALKPPVVPEEVSPFEVIHPETSDKRTADAVVRKPPGKGPFPAVIYLHGGLMNQPRLCVHGSGYGRRVGERGRCQRARQRPWLRAESGRHRAFQPR